MKFLNNVAYAIRTTLMIMLGMVNTVSYHAMMWLATEAELKYLKEKTDGRL